MQNPLNLCALSPALSRNAIIALRQDKEISAAFLALRISAWRKVFESLTENHFALYLTDSLEFTAALIAATQTHKIAHLPSNTLPETCEALKASGLHLFIGDFPKASITSPLNTTDSEDHHSVAPIIFSVPKTAEFVIYTSGSTGQPQAVLKRVTQMTTEVETLEQMFGERVGKAWIVSTVSHHHIYGLLFKIFWTLYSGRTMVVTPLNFPEELVALTARHSCALISSPAHLKRFCDSPLWATLSFNANLVFSSGGALDRATALKLKDLARHAPIEIYGSSETGGIAWRQQSLESDASWSPLPRVLWRANEEDVLCVRSPHLYNDDWWTMADKIEIKDKNRFLLVGRVDRVIKLEEKKVALDSIEVKLRETHLIHAARVIPVEMDHHQRVSLAAFVVLNEEGRAILAKHGKLHLNRLLREKLSTAFERIALPRMWRYLEALPVNTQGKTTYAELKAQLHEKESPVTEPPIKIITLEKNHCLLQLTVTPDLIYFQGHFDAMPILPGVTQVEWAIRFAQRYLQVPDTFCGIRQLKFQQIIKPKTTAQLDLSFDAEKSILAFRYFSEDTPYASGQALFDPSLSLIKRLP